VRVKVVDVNASQGELIDRGLRAPCTLDVYEFRYFARFPRKKGDLAYRT